METINIIYLTIGIALGFIFSGILNSKPKEEVLPEVGGLWVFKGKNGDPFPKDRSPIEITGVCNGWVRYDMSIFKNQTMKLSSFLYCYAPYIEE